MLTTAVAPANELGVEFAANVVRSNTKQPDSNTKGRIVVGRDAFRTEGSNNNHMVHMIYLPAQQKVWVLFPEQKRYMVQEKVEVKRPPLPHEPESPCRTDANYECRNLGAVQIGDRSTYRWQVSVKNGNQTQVATLWVDSRLPIAIREEYDDGTVVEMVGIVEGPQGTTPFTVPQDYQLMTATAASPPPGDGRPGGSGTRAK